ncbi:hypothetical protein CFO_g3950 [Ceratocystis platani]|uniref:DUF7707 domain-containing protein n=1 Tax=Ceratocystis fimbriata f. sp. platani TaxID=88771 RepID=A0A0F8B1W8_CERFI|nr:hypothetical protein CFO_g3950 [Ceratocystis platani]
MRACTVLAAFAVGAHAVVNLTYGNTTVNIGSIDASEKSAYCRGQRNTCDQLCSDGTDTNTCDTSTLDYTCTCSDGEAPSNLSLFSTSMDAYLCEAAYSQCISASTGDATAQKACKTNIEDKCGKKDVSEAASSSSTTSSTTLSTATATGTASGSTGTGSITTTAPTTTTTVASGASAAVVGAGAFAAAILAAIL